jgi:hypothetical protein
MKPTEIMHYLGINQKFIICDHLNFTSRTSFLNMDQSKYQSLTHNRESMNPFNHSSTRAINSHKVMNDSNYET